MGLLVLAIVPDTRRIPILMLTPAGAAMDRILAFEAGADDVVPRPLCARELALRFRVLLRRNGVSGPPEPEPSPELQHGPLRIDLIRRRVHAGEREVHLSDRELAILALLMRRPGRVFSRQEILERVWGDASVRTSRVVDTHVKGIRRKLGPGAPEIESLRGVGYRLSDRAGGSDA